MEFRKAYGERVAGVVVNATGGGAKQSFKDECDINRIMVKYKRTGTVPLTAKVGRYGDFSQVEDYLAAQVTLKQAEEQFNSLPAEVRKRFNNDPGAMLEFVQDKDNFEEAKELGLLSEAAVAELENETFDEVVRAEPAERAKTVEVVEMDPAMEKQVTKAKPASQKKTAR